MKKSSAKGGAFERKVADMLSSWLTRGVDSKQLIRSVMSGGWTQGTRTDEGWRQVGDLAPNGPAGECFRRMFAVECKHRNGIVLDDLFGREATGLSAWWDKLCTESSAANVLPLLIFRSTGRPIMVATASQVEHAWWQSIHAAAHFIHRGMVIFYFQSMLELDPKAVLPDLPVVAPRAPKPCKGKAHNESNERNRN